MSFLFYCKRLSQQNRNLKNRHTKSGVLFKFEGCPNSSTHCYCYATMKQKTWSTSVTSLSQIHYPSPIISSSFSFFSLLFQCHQNFSTLHDQPLCFFTPSSSSFLLISIENQTFPEGAHAARSACGPSTLLHYGTHHSYYEQ